MKEPVYAVIFTDRDHSTIHSRVGEAVRYVGLSLHDEGRHGTVDRYDLSGLLSVDSVPVT